MILTKVQNKALVRIIKAFHIPGIADQLQTTWRRVTSDEPLDHLMRELQWIKDLNGDGRKDLAGYVAIMYRTHIIPKCIGFLKDKNGI